MDAFTVGSDRVLDLRLAACDIEGSKAHIRMLESIGLLSAEELAVLTDGLDRILADVKAGRFVLEDDVEDIHSQVELLLTRNWANWAGKSTPGARATTRSWSTSNFSCATN